MVIFFDSTPKTVDSRRYCSVSTEFCLAAGMKTKLLDHEYTIFLYYSNVSKIFSNTSKTTQSEMSKRFHSVSDRVFGKPIKRRASKHPERKLSIMSKRQYRINTKRSRLPRRRIVLSSTKGSYICHRLFALDDSHSMEQSVLTPNSIFKSQSTLPRKQNLEQTQEN